MKILLAILLLLTTSCKLIEDEEDLSTNPLYVTYWLQTQDCSGSGKFILLTDVNFNVSGFINSLDKLNPNANWLGSYNVELSRPYKFDAKTVKHVMLHVMTQSSIHGSEFTKCGL